MLKTHKLTIRRWYLLLLLICFVPTLYAQSNLSISGLVKDDSGLEIIGASVSVKGTTKGTLTDLDGQFTLGDVPANSTLVISYIGYISQNVKVTNNSPLKITLKEDVYTLDDVVVVGYGVQRKSDLTGAVSRKW